MVEWFLSVAGAIILSISYGYDVPDSGADPLLQLAEMTLEESARAGTPGSFLVDFLPWSALSTSSPSSYH